MSRKHKTQRLEPTPIEIKLFLQAMRDQRQARLTHTKMGLSLYIGKDIDWDDRDSTLN